MPPFAALQHHFRDFFQQKVGEALRRLRRRDTAPHRAAHQEALIFAHFVRQRLQLLGRQGLRGHINKIALAGIAVLPPQGFRRPVNKALQLGQRFGQHFGAVFGVDHRIAPFVIDNQGRRQTVITEPAGPTSSPPWKSRPDPCRQSPCANAE